MAGSAAPKAHSPLREGSRGAVQAMGKARCARGASWLPPGAPQSFCARRALRRPADQSRKAGRRAT